MTGRAFVLLLSLFTASCGDVSFCTDTNPDRPPNCEICNNGQDDDLDGEIDCEDELCEDSAFCRDGDETAADASATTSSTVPSWSGAAEEARTPLPRSRDRGPSTRR